MKCCEYNTSDHYYKSFTIVIYDRIDCDQYYKTMIQANLALAMSINYDPKLQS